MKKEREKEKARNIYATWENLSVLKVFKIVRFQYQPFED
jgi:hypothetical protein